MEEWYETRKECTNKIMKRGTIVKTPNGRGKIFGRDYHGWCGNFRYKVTLKKNPFGFTPVCYWPSEIKKI